MKRKLSVICIVCLILTFVVSGITTVFLNKIDSKTLKEDELKISELDNKLSIVKAATKGSGLDNKSIISGLDELKVKNDRLLIEKFVKDEVFSFKTIEEYEKLRSNITSKYNIDKNDQFFTYVLPEKTWKSGVNVSDNMIITVNSIEEYVVGIKGDIYSYLVGIQVTINEKTEKMCLFIDVNGKGEITSVTSEGLK